MFKTKLVTKPLLMLCILLLASCELAGLQKADHLSAFGKTSLDYGYIYGDLIDTGNATRLFLRIENIDEPESIVLMPFYKKPDKSRELDVNNNVPYYPPTVYAIKVKPGNYVIDTLVQTYNGPVSQIQKNEVEFIKINQPLVKTPFTIKAGEAKYIGDYIGKSYLSKDGGLKSVYSTQYRTIVRYIKAELTSMIDNYEETTKTLKEGFEKTKGLDFSKAF